MWCLMNRQVHLHASICGRKFYRGKYPNTCQWREERGTYVKWSISPVPLTPSLTPSSQLQLFSHRTYQYTLNKSQNHIHHSPLYWAKPMFENNNPSPRVCVTQEHFLLLKCHIIFLINSPPSTYKKNNFIENKWDFVPWVSYYKLLKHQKINKNNFKKN